VKNLYTAFYNFKNGSSSIRQFYASNVTGLKNWIIADLSSFEEQNITEEEKQILVSCYSQFRDDFKLIEIEDSINVWFFHVSINVEIHVAKTSIIISDQID